MLIKINQHEQDALEGLPYFQQVLYYAGIRPYMDYATGIVGRKRRISYQSLSEKLYVEPHKGYASGSPCKAKIQRALSSLERAGLLSKIEGEDRLIFKCILAEQDFSAENKVGKHSIPLADTNSIPKKSNFSRDFERHSEKADIPENQKADTPPVSGNIIKKYIHESFQISEKLRQKAQEQNLQGVDDEKTRLDFINFHQSRGTQSCNWEAEYLRWLRIREQYQLQEKHHATRKNNASQRRSGFMSAVDIVMQANAERFKKPHGRVIDG